MPTHRRRRSRKVSARRPSGLLAALLVVVAFGAIAVYAGLALKRQIAGYFQAAHHHVSGAARKTAATRSRGTGATLSAASRAPYPPPTGAASAEPSVALATSHPASLPAASAPPAVRAGARLAIIIDDCGNSMERDGRFLKLPIPVTMSVLPMTPHAQEITQAAQSAGKAVILHLPMEPESAQAHPGPGAVTTSMSDDQVQSQVRTDLAALPYVPGANNHMGSKATSDPRVMRDVMEVLRQDDRFFIDSMTSGSSVGSSTAREMGVPTAARDVFLDNSATVPYVEGQLRAAMDVALKQGKAIAIGHPNPATAQALENLIPQMEASGVTFVPAQTLVR
ncbi:MAG: divergent polysaccharide deacetylase family protein [Candidatus Eremiobacteraeota bacterium]|nr:divergent polysaccharide deacetylase family protein [Candidatus Eremiobacteraeota bacterium]MBC5827831.1 divergent polysaccharide deacetylase family protein [Candidatus Eremiobacteraeota bacterium]